MAVEVGLPAPSFSLAAAHRDGVIALADYLGKTPLLLVLFRAIRQWWDAWPVAIRRVTTFGLVVVGWVFFRSDSFAMAGSLLTRMFSWHPGSSVVGGPVLLGILVVAAAAAHVGPNTFEMPHRWSPSYVAGFALLFGLCLLFLYGAPSSPFLYFQF